MQHESRGPRDGAAWLFLGPSATRIPSKFQDPRSARLRVRAGHDRVTCPPLHERFIMPPHEARTRLLPNLLVATACLCVGMLLARAMGF